MRGKCHLILTIAALAAGLAQPAVAQTVYRCGNSYSQTPCEGGSTVTQSAPATREQEEARRAQDADTRKQMRLAEEMEKNRLKQEAFLSGSTRKKVSLPPNPTPVSKSPQEPGARARHKPPHFTARTPPAHPPGKSAADPANSTVSKP